MEKTSFIELSNRNLTKVVLFGSGNAAKKTLRSFNKDSVQFIADNSVNLQGGKYEGFDIISPSNIEKDSFIIICSTAIVEISQQLIKLGFSKDQFVISPILNDLLAIAELEQIKTEFYCTSGTMPVSGGEFGGGLYHCKVVGADVSLTKVYSGPCYGAIEFDGGIFFVDTDKGVYYYKDNNLSHKCELPKGSRAHGISRNSSNGRFYITCSYLDGVLELDESFNVKREFSLSNKLKKSGEPSHHTNDNYSYGNSLYVSMFSSTGNWKNDVFDGCIAEFDIETGERLNDVYSGLYMPHNVKMFNGSLHVLDSLPGHLRYNNMSVQGTFPAFTRGLDFKSGLYYIGQSKNRNYSKVMGVSNNISIDCGVIIFNSELKASRFIQFPHAIGEIHSIVVGNY
jgi:hypothetical protein